MVLLAGSLGLRVGEVLALHWSDIDWDTKTITIQRSFPHQRIGEVKAEASHAMLPLDDTLLGILKAHKTATGESELVFPSPRTGGLRWCHSFGQRKRRKSRYRHLVLS